MRPRRRALLQLIVMTTDGPGQMTLILEPQRVTPPIAMQIAPGVGEPASLDMRARLIEGTLANEVSRMSDV